MPGRLQKRHDALAKGDALFGVVGDAEREQSIRKAHDAQADLSRASGHFCDRIERIVIDVNHVIEKMHGLFDGLFQQVEIKARLAVLGFKHGDEVDGTQITAFVRQQRLLAARIRALDFAGAGNDVIPVQPVEKDDARFACLPGGVYDFIKHLACGEL
ncbi:hypothetical protein SDC9_156852 [bioreactor metagenome]|uniref:Uncharacterized protein n=1 Tax=bioreactor metagenome TaxID=1076179 RepID=A0A645F5M0_9ZZZZ